jgi:hypothetical protein
LVASVGRLSQIMKHLSISSRTTLCIFDSQKCMYWKSIWQSCSTKTITFCLFGSAYWWKLGVEIYVTSFYCWKTISALY